MTARAYGLKPIEPTEAQVLNAVLRYLRRDARVAWVERFNTGAHAVEAGNSRRFIRYAFKGCSDILGQLVTGHFLAVEVKRQSRSAKASEAQAAFLARVTANGGCAILARSIDDVQSALDDFWSHDE